jgi:uncharacterized protein
VRALAVTLIVLVGLTGAAIDARGQCSSSASSCVSCHEAQRLHPVLADGRPWHGDHGFGDLCAACHGGDPVATSKDAAHSGMHGPLVNPEQSCAGCHAGDAVQRAARYRATVAPAPSTGPPAPPSTLGSSGAAPSSSATANRLLAAVAVGLGLLLVVLVAGKRQRIRPLEWLRAKSWSAIVAGAGLGATVTISEAVCGRPISASGAFDKLAAYLGDALFPRSPYYAYVMRPGITWQVWLMLGVLLGSFASAKLARVARVRWLPDAEWVEHFGRRRSVRLIVGFLGAVLMQVGAGIAGGCTSGLAISGGAVLSPAAFVFMAGMFAGGIPTALSWARLRRGMQEKK